MGSSMQYTPRHLSKNFNAEIIYWQYFLSLEAEFNKCLRFVEMDKDNEDVFSIEFFRILLSTCTEIENILKLICGEKYSFNACRNIFIKHHSEFNSVETTIPRYNLRLIPWENWGTPNPKNPDWWEIYKNLKHDRTAHFSNATLKNARNAIGGLFCLLRAYYLRNFSKLYPHATLYDYDGRPQFRATSGDDTLPGF